MKYVSGKILIEEGFKKGYIGFEKNKIKEKEYKHPPKKPIFKGLIVPSFINFHTHIGDSFIKEKKLDLPKDIEKLVAPPNGLKHQLLKNTSTEEIIKGMEKSIRIMLNSGTKFFCDFREKGYTGINEIKKPLKKYDINGIILSRPNSMEYNKKEIDLILKNSDGIGISSISDCDYSIIKKIAKKTKEKNKIFALHASERKREDIDKIINLKPDFVVHMTKATKSDLIRLKENNIPLVICPRSNSYFGMQPNYELIKKTGVKILVGTDNCMLNTPNLIEEIKFIRRKTNSFSLESLLKALTYDARKVLNLSPNILALNSSADFNVLDAKSLKILYSSKSRIDVRDDI